MSDRHEQARAEAERRYPAYPEFDQDDRDHTNAMRYIFLGGVEWADANPQPRRMKRSDVLAIYGEELLGRHVTDLTILAFVRELGIEVTDDE